MNGLQSKEKLSNWEMSWEQYHLFIKRLKMNKSNIQAFISSMCNRLFQTVFICMIDSHQNSLLIKTDEKSFDTRLMEIPKIIYLKNI